MHRMERSKVYILKISNMEKYLASYDQCLALKELGFRERVNYYFEDGALKIHPTVTGWDFNTSFTTCISRPTRAQVFEWFREKYDTESHIEYCPSSEDDIVYYFYFFTANDDYESITYGTYEEAEDKCIEFLINIVKNEYL